MEIKTLVLSPLAQNTRILFSREKHEAVIVDPACKSDEIQNFLDKEKLKAVAILLTHSHFDHCGGVAQLGGLPLYGHPAEKGFRSRIREVCAIYGLSNLDYENSPEPSIYLKGGEKITLLGEEFTVYHIPGHSPGSLAFYCPSGKFVLSGDLLFKGGVGRTDLPLGNEEDLISSLKLFIEVIPDDTMVLSGHGPDTILGDERAGNQFLKMWGVV